MRKIWSTLIVLTFAIVASWTPAYAEDYTFEIPGEDEENADRLTWGGNLDTSYTLLRPQDSSPLFGLQFADDEITSDYLSQYVADLYLNADYRTQDIGFHLKTHLDYQNDATDPSFDLFEMYGNYNLSLSAFIQAGKIRYNWGTGYAFNPVGFVNPAKDPTDPDATKAGVLSGNIEVFKSFSAGTLKTAALTVVVVPPEEQINARFAEPDATTLAAKLSLLVGTADVDLLGYYEDDEVSRWGADFAYNLRPELEVHGEIAYFGHALKSTIADNQLVQTEEDGYEWLLGVRWLNPWDMTVIAEYYRNDAGLTGDEFQTYLTFLRHSLDSGNESQINRASGYMQQYFNGNTLMQEYLYLSVQKSEPFDWLYFTPTVSVLYNLYDESLLVSCALSYKPVTNIELLFNPSFMIGDEDTEYGSQRFEQKIKMSGRWYF